MNQRERHLAELKALGYIRDTLRPLAIEEGRAHKAAERYCNGEITEAQSDAVDQRVTERVKRLFGGELPPGFFINGDPRGYALKIEQPNDKRLISFTDWGGYGILAPEFETDR
jgi:hypothetical protein